MERDAREARVRVARGRSFRYDPVPPGHPRILIDAKDPTSLAREGGSAPRLAPPISGTAP